MHIEGHTHREDIHERNTHTEGKRTPRRDILMDKHTHGGTYMAGTYMWRRIYINRHILT